LDIFYPFWLSNSQLAGRFMNKELNECRALLRQPDAVDQLMSKGIPLHEIERMLDEADFEEACRAKAKPKHPGLIGRLLWT
jgi:hypothetical protein